MAIAIGTVAVMICAACGSAAARLAPRDAAGTVWLCRPGLADDPCTSDLSTTVIGPGGRARIERAKVARDPPIDCFYVYPTVSTQPSTNANLDIDPEERAVAMAQASRFSQVCRVWAPMYPQLTLAAIFKPGGITAAGAATAYAGVASAFEDYLTHYNHGRGIVFIGHSQGASLLISLLKLEVDPSTSLRRRLVSALLMGGNPTVPVGQRVGGTFEYIPTCDSSHETGCIVAYSSFDTTPPSNSLFGRVGQGLNPFAQVATPGLQVVCVNPASLIGGTHWLQPYFPAAVQGQRPPVVTTPWVSYPHEYTAHCEYEDGASWLEVDHITGPTDERPVVSQVLGPAWGLHLDDVNLALGNLVPLVRSQATAYDRRGAGR